MRMIVLGCGRMGAGLAQMLLQRGHAVTVIDKDPTPLAGLGRAFEGHTVVGGGIERSALLAAGISTADGLAAVTASDDVNLVAARVARQIFHVPRVVARVYEPGKADLYRRLSVQTITTTTWGVNRIAELLCYVQFDTVQSVGSGDVDMVDLPVPALLVDHTVSDLTVPGEIHVAAITRGGHTFLPTLGAVFQPDDQLHLAVLAASAPRLQQLLGLT
jgi:trk system potassium uptake protein TrkA